MPDTIFLEPWCRPSDISQQILRIDADRSREIVTASFGLERFEMPAWLLAPNACAIVGLSLASDRLRRSIS